MTYIPSIISGAFLLTQKDVFFDKFHANRLAASILGSDKDDCKIDMLPPAILKVSNFLTLNDSVWKYCDWPLQPVRN